jgi:hypothetical protein
MECFWGLISFLAPFIAYEIAEMDFAMSRVWEKFVVRHFGPMIMRTPLYCDSFFGRTPKSTNV